MKTQTKYEEIILSEIRTMPPPVLSQAVKMLRLLKEGIKGTAKTRISGKDDKTGFCGAWNDARNADEIIFDIITHRTGFGGRKLDL